ncbi:MAG: MarC family protein [Bacteroidia bacterium]
MIGDIPHPATIIIRIAGQYQLISENRKVKSKTARGRSINYSWYLSFLIVDSLTTYPLLLIPTNDYLNISTFVNKSRAVNFNLKQIASASMILFAVIDVLGCIPVLIDLNQKMGQINARKATLVSGAIMIVFLFLGEPILKLIGLDIPAFALAGALVIFFIGIEMVLGIKLSKEEVSSSTASVVPIAFPLIAGTGTLTTLLSVRAEFAIENIVIAILINLVFVYIVLKNTKYLEHLLGAGGIIILRKVFGIVLLAIAIKLFLTNLGSVLNLPSHAPGKPL